MYLRSGNEVYKRLTQFWGKLFLINFAMGVVTGIVQEFQFGMNCRNIRATWEISSGRPWQSRRCWLSSWSQPSWDLAVRLG